LDNSKNNKPSFKLMVIFSLLIVIAGIAWGLQAGVFTFKGNASFEQDVEIIGVLTGASNARIAEGLDLIDLLSQVAYSFYIQGEGVQPLRNLPADYNKVLVISNETENNPANIFVVFWDAITERPSFVIQEQTDGRASVFENSLLIGKDQGTASMDLDYTLCSGFSLIDCDTNSTGADGAIEDDFEVGGSIQTHENLIVDENILGAIPYGSMWQFNSMDEVTILIQGEMVAINDFNQGLSNAFVLLDMNRLQTLRAGKYKVDWSESFLDENKKEIQGGVSVNEVLQVETVASIEGQKGASSMGGTGILDLSLNDEVSLVITNLDDTNGLTIQHANLTLVRVGEAS